MKKKYFLYAIVLSLVLTSIGVAAYASQTQEANSINGLVAKIAQKFNLPQSDVQSVFDEHNTEMKATREQKMTEMKEQSAQKVKDELAQAVIDGKLTQAQVDLLLAKKAELQAEMPTINQSASKDSLTQKTKEEMSAERETRQAEAKTRQDALKQWATDNGILEEYLNLICGMNGKGGRGMGGGMGNNFSK